MYSPWMSASSGPTDVDVQLDAEIEHLSRTVTEEGEMSRTQLSSLVGARYWGPGRFRAALREAVRDGLVVELGRGQVGPPRDAYPQGDSGTRQGQGERSR